MGFGKKKDPDTNRTIDLDATYKKIIRPAVESCGCKCVRADEITESGIIDRSMYALLYHADLVIADISTYNPNAIYELGVRHAMRRYSTIIIKEDQGRIPFDIGHNRTLNYCHLGNEISDAEAKKSIGELKRLINEVLTNSITDSPLYTYIPKIREPSLTDEDLRDIIGELHKNEDTIYSLTEKAKVLMYEKRFDEAVEVWKRLSEKAENEIYYIQQQTLCRYKSESPSRLKSLTDALQIIGKISECNDTETLGITGAINKRLWEETKEVSYLNAAIEFYKKGWNLYTDYYTGENYAYCLEEKSRLEAGDEKIYYKMEAKKTREEIVWQIQKSLEKPDAEDLMWKYATLSNCYLACGDKDNAEKYENLFLLQNPVGWEVETFSKTKLHTQNYINRA
jgi:hypothetical protein